jgi:hypothetical protein
LMPLKQRSQTNNFLVCIYSLPPETGGTFLFALS